MGEIKWIGFDQKQNRREYGRTDYQKEMVRPYC